MGEKMNLKCFIIPKHFLPCQTWTVGIKQKPYESENLIEKINLLLNFKIIYIFELQLDFKKCVIKTKKKLNFLLEIPGTKHYLF